MWGGLGCKHDTSRLLLSEPRAGTQAIRPTCTPISIHPSGIYIFLNPSIWRYIHPFTNPSIGLKSFIHLYRFPSILSIHLGYIYTSIHQSIYPSIHLGYIYISILQSIRPSIHLEIHPFTNPSIGRKSFILHSVCCTGCIGTSEEHLRVVK